MSQRVVEIRLGDGVAGDREFRDLVDSIYRAERLAALRQLSLTTLAILGAFLWVGLNFPGALPGTLLRVADGLFAAVFIAAMVVVVREHHWLTLQRKAIDRGS